MKHLLIDCSGTTNSSDTKSTSKTPNAASFVMFSPEQLHFNASVCVPIISEFKMINHYKDKELHLFSVSSSNPQFHPVMFQPQVCN